jgi:hypothetical protein
MMLPYQIRKVIITKMSINHIIRLLWLIKNLMKKSKSSHIWAKPYKALKNKILSRKKFTGCRSIVMILNFLILMLVPTFSTGPKELFQKLKHQLHLKKSTWQRKLNCKYLKILKNKLQSKICISHQSHWKNK